MDCEFRKCVSYLNSQLPGWAQDERLNSTSAAAICRWRPKQPFHNREQERKRFSCAGLSRGDHIGAGQCCGNGLRLYRCGLDEAVPREVLGYRV